MMSMKWKNTFDWTFDNLLRLKLFFKRKFCKLMGFNFEGFLWLRNFDGIFMGKILT